MAIFVKTGCAGQTRHERAGMAEVDNSRWFGNPTKIAARLKAVERQKRELRQANEILRGASAFLP
jgi:class 3 adenylate cyclase